MDIPIELFLGFIGVSIALAIFGFLRNPPIPATIVMGGMFILVIAVATTNIEFDTISLDVITDYDFNIIYEIPFGSTQYRLNGTNTIIAERFIISDSPRLAETFNIVNINLSRVGTLIGNYTIGVFNGQGNTIDEFCTYQASILLTGAVDTSCHFPEGYQLSVNDRVGIKYTGGNATNYIIVRADTTNIDPYAQIEKFSNGWTNVNTNDDMRMKLLMNKPINTYTDIFEFTELPKTLFALIGVMIMLVGGLMVMRD